MTKKNFAKKSTDILFDAEFHSLQNDVFEFDFRGSLQFIVSFLADVSTSFLCGRINYTEKTNTTKDQIILIVLRASNKSTKNCVTALHWFSVFFMLIKVTKEKLFFNSDKQKHSNNFRENSRL